MLAFPFDIQQLGRIARRDLERAVRMFLDSVEPSPQRMLDALREAPPGDWSEDFLPFLEWCAEQSSGLIASTDELNAAISLLFERLEESPLLFSHRHYAPGDEISELVSRRLGARLQLLPSEGDRLVALEPFELVIGTHLGYLRPSLATIPVRRVLAAEQQAIAASWKLLQSLPEQPAAARHVLKVRFHKLLRTPNQDFQPLLQRMQRLTAPQRVQALERTLAFQLRQSFPPERRPNLSGLQEELAEHDIVLELTPLQKLVGLASWLLEHIQPDPEVASGKVQLTHAELSEYLSWEGRAAHLYRFRSSEGVRCLNSLLLLLAEGQEPPPGAQELLAELVELRETFLKRLKLRPLSLVAGLDPLLVLQARLRTPSEHLWADMPLQETLLRQWEQLRLELIAYSQRKLSWLEPSEPSGEQPPGSQTLEPLVRLEVGASEVREAEAMPFESSLPPPLPPSPGLPFDVTSFELPPSLPPRPRELSPPLHDTPPRVPRLASGPDRSSSDTRPSDPSFSLRERSEQTKPEPKKLQPNRPAPPLEEVPLLGPIMRTPKEKVPAPVPPPLFDDALGPVPASLKRADDELDDGLLEDDDEHNPDTVSVVVHLSELPTGVAVPTAEPAPSPIHPPTAVMPEHAEELEVDETAPPEEEEDGSERSVVVYLVSEDPEPVSRSTSRVPEAAPDLPFASGELPSWAPSHADASPAQPVVETEEAYDELVEAGEDSISEPALTSQSLMDPSADSVRAVADDEAPVGAALEVVSLEHALQAHGRLLGEHGGEHAQALEGEQAFLEASPSVFQAASANDSSLASLLEQRVAGSLVLEPGADDLPEPENVRGADVATSFNLPPAAQGEKLAGTLEQALYRGHAARPEHLDPMSEHSFDEFSGPAFDSAEIFHADHDGTRARTREAIRGPSPATLEQATGSGQDISPLPMPEADEDDEVQLADELPHPPAGTSPELELEADADGQAALPMPEDLEYDEEDIRGRALSLPLKGLNSNENQSEQAAQIQAELDSLMEALEHAEPLTELEERGRPRLRIVPRPEPARIIDPLEMLDQAEQLLDEEQNGRSLVPRPAIHPDEWETPREVEDE